MPTIDRRDLAEGVDLSFFSGDGEASQLLHVHLFLDEVAIEEGKFDIHVVDVPAFLSCQCEEDSDRFHACHESECIIVVDPLLLDEAVRHQFGLVFDHRT